MNIHPSSPSTPPDGPHRFEPAGQVVCPAGRDTRLRVINRESMLVECGINGADICPKTFRFGGGCYCGLLFKFSRQSS